MGWGRLVAPENKKPWRRAQRLRRRSARWQIQKVNPHISPRLPRAGRTEPRGKTTPSSPPWAPDGLERKRRTRPVDILQKCTDYTLARELRQADMYPYSRRISSPQDPVVTIM